MTGTSTHDSVHVGKQAIATQHSTTLKTGIYLGGLLIAVMLVALFIANHVPGSERYALERNAIFCGLFIVVMCIPVVRYLHHPVRMFLSALIGWAIFIVAYNITGMFYENLFQILRSPFEALVEGFVVYGVIASVSWVGSMCIQARHVPITPRRRRTDHLHQQP